MSGCYKPSSLSGLCLNSNCQLEDTVLKQPSAHKLAGVSTLRVATVTKWNH